MIGNVRNKKSPSLVGVQISKVMVFSSMSCTQINSSHCQTAWHELVKGRIHMENTIKRISAVQSSLHLLGTPKAKCTKRRWRHWGAIGLVRVFLFPRSSLECTTCLACAGTCMLQWGELWIAIHSEDKHKQYAFCFMCAHHPMIVGHPISDRAATRLWQ